MSRVAATPRMRSVTTPSQISYIYNVGSAILLSGKTYGSYWSLAISSLEKLSSPYANYRNTLMASV